MSRFAAMSLLLSLGSYSRAAGVDQTGEQIRPLVAPFALHPGAPALEAPTYSNDVLEEPRMPRHLSLNIDELAQEADHLANEQEPWDPGLGVLTEFPPSLTDLDENFSPEVTSLPAYDLWHLKSRPLLADPGWVPTEGTLIGPGISFGIGFPVRYLGDR
jgi:hypothetical protein